MRDCATQWPANNKQHKTFINKFIFSQKPLFLLTHTHMDALSLMMRVDCVAR